MVKIRLKRMGTTKRPVYRLVVADSRSPRDGRFIEAIGFYDPLPNPAVVRVDADKVRTWIRHGARPSDSARRLLVQQGILQAAPRPERPAAPAPAVTAQEIPEEAVEANPAPLIEEAGEHAAEEDEAAESEAGDAAAEEDA
ncbi:MAG: 30S ribosomal protein S16 [Candidatus Dormibacteraeota bacterium]|nr:30S ribosomal protein S16 [Candidatus Dormibacteraeota bacterium]